MASREGCRSASDSPKSAARFVRRSASAIRARHVREGQSLSPFRSECLALIRWSELARKLVSSQYVEQFVYFGSGAEHRVYHDPIGKQAIKTTLRGQFGHSLQKLNRTATPLEYLSRLAWHNAIFGDKIRIVGVSHDGEGYVEIVHSQPWIHPHDIRPAPFPEEIDAYFADFGFQRANADESAPPLFYNSELNLVVADAHDANVIRDKDERIVAIDVVIGTPGPSVLAEVLRR